MFYHLTAKFKIQYNSEKESYANLIRLVLKRGSSPFTILSFVFPQKYFRVTQ